MPDILRTLIVPAADAPLARQIARTLAPVGGSAMWLTGLSPTGTPPATHYVSTGLIGPEFAALVPCQYWERDEDGNWTETGSEPGNAGMVVAACAMADPPLTLTPKQVQAMMDAADITPQEPFTAYARLGLQLVQEEAL